MRKRKILRKQKVASIVNLPVINSNAAGLDIASDEIMTCVPSTATLTTSKPLAPSPLIFMLSLTG